MSGRQENWYRNMTPQQRIVLLARRSNEATTLPRRKERKTARKNFAPLALECAIDSFHMTLREELEITRSVSGEESMSSGDQRRVQIEMIKATLFHPAQVLFSKRAH